METLDIKRHCLGCWTDEKHLQTYVVKCVSLKDLFQTDSLSLCYLCRKRTRDVELFVRTIQNNQLLFEDCDLITRQTLATLQPQTKLVNLSIKTLAPIELSETNIQTSEFIITSSKSDVNVKFELKEEENGDEDYYNGDDFSEFNLKAENEDFPISALLKEDFQMTIDNTQLIDKINSTVAKKRVKKKKCIKKVKIKREITDNKVEKLQKNYVFKLVKITRKQYMQQLSKMRDDIKYQSLTYKCDLCVIGFNIKGSYMRHMEKHSESNGNHQCDICKQYMESESKLFSHVKHHTYRYQCKKCGLTRSTARYIKEHYRIQHLKEPYQSCCPHCNKKFNRPSSLRAHISYKHVRYERVTCAHCDKTYANKTLLRAHIMMKHSKNMVGSENINKYSCECGSSFHSPSLLKQHSRKHSHAKDYYCVECDKSFKSNTSLKRHYNTSSVHISYKDLPLACPHCDKRFAIRRDLTHHMNRVHLDIKPFQCDSCDKRYANNWSLKEHHRLRHEGYKRPLQFPCSVCDKIFDLKNILKEHMRTHTGERPYHCTKCPASFTQAGILRTHDRLIHLKLTRNGTPKHAVVKL